MVVWCQGLTRKHYFFLGEINQGKQTNKQSNNNKRKQYHKLLCLVSCWLFFFFVKLFLFPIDYVRLSSKENIWLKLQTELKKKKRVSKGLIDLFSYSCIFMSFCSLYVLMLCLVKVKYGGRTHIKVDIFCCVLISLSWRCLFFSLYDLTLQIILSKDSILPNLEFVSEKKL